MYIEPNTQIRILQNVPLDPTQDHTIYWDVDNPITAKAAQANYFASKTKYVLDRQSYQRVQRGWMRIEIKAENLYDCNYLMFRNISFGDKWFYAFIKSVEYINNEVSQIEFEIDEMQTWHFDYSLEDCFVEREHSASDVPGENLVPEKLDTGEYVSRPYTWVQSLSELSIVIATTFDVDNQGNYSDYGGNMYGGLFAGLCFHTFPNTTQGVADAKQFIEDATSAMQSDGIVSVFYAPTRFMLDPSSTGTKWESVQIDHTDDSAGSTPIGQTFDGYVPINKKLLTYPFNFLYVTNLQGGSAIYPYEYFSVGQWGLANFAVTGDFNPSPTVLLVPKNYKGQGVDVVTAPGTTEYLNFDEQLSLTGYPQCAYNIDLFKAWLAQKSVTLPFDLASGLATSLGGMSSALGAARNATSIAQIASAATHFRGAATGGLFNVLGEVISSVGEGVLYHKMPPQAKGQQTASVLASVLQMNFFFTRKHVTRQFAEIIDNFFTMFGYATHRVKKPNRNVRTYWTYTKTVGCVLNGSVPADDAVRICDIYNHGITFWNDPTKIGQYDTYARANVPLTPST